MKNQSGAALAEFVILMLVMLPIMFGIPMIGKLIDLRQTTVQASRYSAWEGTVHSDVSAPDDIKARFFSDSTVQLGADASEANALWGGAREGDVQQSTADSEFVAAPQSLNNVWQSGLSTVEIDEETGAAVAYSSAYDSGADGRVARTVETTIGSILSTADGFTGGDWIDDNDTTQGMLRAGVRADVKGNGFFETLSFDDATVIMHDNWSADNDDTAAKRARAMVPSGALESIGNTISYIGVLPFFKELGGLDEAFGHVDTEHLPESETSTRVLEEFGEEE